MLKLSIFVCLLAGFSGAETPPADESVYVIFTKGKPICAGTAIRDSRIISITTTARCASIPDLTLKLGNLKFGQDAEKVLQVLVHPYYRPTSPDYDVAILKFENRDPFLHPTVFEPATEILASKTLKVGTWNVSDVYWTTVTVIDRQSCQKMLGDKFRVSSKMLCAKVPDPKTVPNGSPLIFERKLVGVALSGTEAGNEGLPIVFTNIANSEIYSFIDKYT